MNPTKSSRVWYTSAGFSFWPDVVETGRHPSSKTRLCNACLLSITLQMNIRALSSMKGQVHLWSKDNFIIRLELFVKCIVRGKPHASLSDRTAMLTEIVLSEEELMVFWLLGNDHLTNNPRHISLEWPSLESNLLLAWTLLSVLHCFAVVCCCSKCLCLVRCLIMDFLNSQHQDLLLAQTLCLCNFHA